MPRFLRYVTCILHNSASPFVRILTNREREKRIQGGIMRTNKRITTDDTFK